MITSPHNEKLKTIRKLRRRRERERTGLFFAEGEDLLEAAALAGVDPEFALVADVDVEAELLSAVSSLGSGTRAIGVYRQRWSEPGYRQGASGREAEEAALSVYLHGVRDPGNVGTLIRTAHALCDGPVILGPGCADPYSPKAVRASMGSVFARPPARSLPADLPGTRVALDPRAESALTDLTIGPPVVVCIGSEREGLPPELISSAEEAARVPIRRDGPESLNAAIAAALALYEVTTRMAARV